MTEFIAANLHLMVSAFMAAIAAAVYFSFQERINFWWMNFLYGLPLIGKAIRLSRDHSQASQPGWFNAERTLCKDYKKYIHFKSREAFEQYQNYLRKAEDNGRSPIPLAILLIMVVLVAAEGLGFSYLLGTWMASEGSANTHTILMVAIVSVLATILAFITHAAGHQLYRSGLVKRSLTGWAQSNPKPDLSRISLSLNDKQNKDDGQADYVQVLARVGREYSYAMVVIAVIAIIGIASLSTWMRYENLVRQQTEQTMGLSAEVANSGNPFAGAGNDGLVVPAEVTASQKEAQQQGVADSNSSMKSEGLAAFLTLAIIFVVTQIVGIYAGYKWGFAGKESKNAYRATRGFSTYDEFIAYYEPRIDCAQAMLQRMQQKMAAGSINGDRKLEKTFRDFLLEDRQHVSAFDKATAQASSHTLQTAPASNYQVAGTSPAPHEHSLESALLELERMEDKQQKKAFLAQLPDMLRTEVMAEIKRRKEAGEAERLMAEKAKLDAELDSLLD